MHTYILDPYRVGSSLIHRLDPRVKFILAMAFLLSVALTPIGAWPLYIILYATLLAVEILSELGLGYVLKRALLVLPFVLAAFPILFTVADTSNSAPLLSIPLGNWVLTITRQGVVHFFSIVLKSWLSVQMAIVLTASTPFPKLLMAMRAVRIPRLLVAMIGLMWRYLFVLVDEALRLLRARDARSGHPERPQGRVGGSVVWRARVTGGMAGNLFLRAFERADRTYAAMTSRGYDGEVRTMPLPPIPRVQRAVLWSGVATLALLTVLGLLLWG